jgi:hypothetical protein
MPQAVTSVNANLPLASVQTMQEIYGKYDDLTYPNLKLT